VDIYVPKYDLVIELDGPCHYQEMKKYKEVTSLDELEDISPYMLNPKKLISKIVAHHHENVVRFDY